MNKTMENTEFNLSILENAASPNVSKDCSSIVSMIKEEIDIKTEDEMDNQKSLKSPRISSNRKESLDFLDLENLFKSPQNGGKYKSAARLLTPRRSQHPQNVVRNGRTVESLGAIKSGRSSTSLGRRKRFSVSRSSQDETSGLSDFLDTVASPSLPISESPKKILKNNINANGNTKNIIEVDVATSTQAQITVHASQDQKDSPKNLPLNSLNGNENLVENSENSGAAAGKKRLRNTKKTVKTKVVKEKAKNGKEAKKKIKKMNKVSLRKKLENSSQKITKKIDNDCQENKKDDEIKSPSLKKRKISASPLKGLTQEMKNSPSLDSDYITMGNSANDDMIETMSFTFETIELLNEYEDVDQHASNEILSKILSSPVAKIKEETLNIENIDPMIPWDFIESQEDPLYIDNTTENISAMCNKNKENNAANSKNGANKNCNALETINENKKTTSTRFNRTKEEENELLERNAIFFEENKDCVHKVVEIQRALEKSKERLVINHKTLDILESLNIKLRHPVLPQHHIGKSAGTSALSSEERKEFMQYAPLNRKVYTPSEDLIIKKNWIAFCKLHQWNPKNVEPFFFLRHRNKLIMPDLVERRKFVQFLADGLPSRPLCSVYNRFRNLYTKYSERGSRYTKDEDLKIFAYLQHNTSENNGSKFGELAKVLNRTRHSVFCRHKKLVEKMTLNEENKVRTRIQWNLTLVAKFISKLMDVTLTEDFMDLKDAFIPKVVWKKIETKMKIHYEVLQRFWEQQLHLQLFSPTTLYIKEIKFKLIEYIHVRNFRHSRDINWNNVAKFFDGIPAAFLRKNFNHLTMKAAASVHPRTLREIVKWLYNKEIKALKTDPNDKCLPRIRYANGIAEFVEEDIEIIHLSARILDSDALVETTK